MWSIRRSGLMAPESPPSSITHGSDILVDGSNTGFLGAGVSVGDLVPVSGLSITSSGVYELLDVTGNVTIETSNVTFRKSRVTSSDRNGQAITLSSGVTNVLIEFVEADGTYNNLVVVTGDDGVGNAAEWTLSRCHIHGGGDGIRGNQGVTVSECLISDLWRSSDADLHCDGFQRYLGTGANIRIERSRFDLPTRASGGGCIMIGQEGGDAAGPVDIVDNYFDGGNYSLYYAASGGNGSIVGNRWGEKYYACSDYNSEFGGGCGSNGPTNVSIQPDVKSDNRWAAGPLLVGMN